MGSERVAMMCGGICVRLDAHLPRKLALFLIWYKTPRGGKTAEISKILTFLHGRPPSQSAQSLRPACKRLSLAGGVADCVRTGRREASMGLICRFQGTRGQLWRPSRRAEQCPTHCHLAQTTSVTRVRQALAMRTHGRTSNTRRGAGSCSWLQKAMILTEAWTIASNANTWGVKIGAGQTTQWADAPHTGMHTYRHH